MLKCKATAQGRLLGTDNPSSKLSDAQVNEVRRLRAMGLSYLAISRQVGCSLSGAQKIVVGTLRGQHPARTLYRLTSEDLPQVAALHAKGNGYENIAKALGATRSSTRLALLEVKKHAQRQA
jgi:hypothetical protein